VLGLGHDGIRYVRRMTGSASTEGFGREDIVSSMVARKSNAAALRSTTRNKKAGECPGFSTGGASEDRGGLAWERDEASIAVSGTAFDILFELRFYRLSNNHHNGKPTAACRKRGNESVDPISKSTC